MIYDAKQRSEDIKSIQPVLQEMADNDEIGFIIINISKKDQSTLTLKFGLDSVADLYRAIGMLEVAKADFTNEVCSVINSGEGTEDL